MTVKDNLPQHVAIIMDPPAQHYLVQTAYSAVAPAGCFGGRDSVKFEAYE